MQNSKGFGLVEIVLAVITVLVLVGVGYIFVQKMVENNDQGNQNISNQQPDQADSDQEVDVWTDYSFEQYGLTFKYPANWQVEVATVEGFENQPNILVTDSQGGLILGIYGYRGNDDGCSIPAYDSSNQPGLKIGQHKATLLETCPNVEKWIGVGMVSNDKHLLAITTNFLGTSTEQDARLLLESMTGLMPAIIN